VLILGSTQLILFGLLGEYVGRLYLETKRRPLFVIDQVLTQNASASEQYRAPREHAAVPGDV
jgi:polyisoprenyl-phosphate glycosyltransferase